MFDPEFQNQIKRITSPIALRDYLITTGIFIYTFEYFKNILIKRIQSFFCDMPYDESGEIVTSQQRYKKEVLRDKNIGEFLSCVDWLISMNCLDGNDRAVLKEMVDFRNALVHESEKLVKADLEQVLTQIKELRGLLRKTEIWWIENFVIPTNPDYDNVEVDSSTIRPGTELFIEMLYDVALGKNDEAFKYYEQFFGPTSSK